MVHEGKMYIRLIPDEIEVHYLVGYLSQHPVVKNVNATVCDNLRFSVSYYSSLSRCKYYIQCGGIRTQSDDFYVKLGARKISKYDRLFKRPIKTKRIYDWRDLVDEVSFTLGEIRYVVPYDVTVDVRRMKNIPVVAFDGPSPHTRTHSDPCSIHKRLSSLYHTGNIIYNDTRKRVSKSHANSRGISSLTPGDILYISTDGNTSETLSIVEDIQVGRLSSFEEGSVDLEGSPLFGNINRYDNETPSRLSIECRRNTLSGSGESDSYESHILRNVVTTPV